MVVSRLHRLAAGLIAGFVGALLSAGQVSAAGEQQPKTSTGLEGRWHTVSIERNGKLITDPQAITGMRLVFVGGTVLITGLYGSQEERCSFAVRDATLPKQIDWTRPNGTKVEMLYELRDDTLRIAFPFLGSNVRPTAISGAADSKTIVMTLKRDSK